MDILVQSSPAKAKLATKNFILDLFCVKISNVATNIFKLNMPKRITKDIHLRVCGNIIYVVVINLSCTLSSYKIFVDIKLIEFNDFSNGNALQKL